MVKAETIVPEVRLTDFYHGPAKGLSPLEEISPKILASNSTNWSGFVITDNANAFAATNTMLIGRAIVPKPHILGWSGKPPNEGYCSIWVGIDGLKSADVLQCGVQMQYNWPSTATRWYAWIEWYPQPEVEVGLPVSWGEEIYLQVAYYDGIGHVIMFNFNRNQKVVLELKPLQIRLYLVIARNGSWKGLLLMESSQVWPRIVAQLCVAAILFQVSSQNCFLQVTSTTELRLTSR
jgi:hypothetical protein